MASQIGFRLSDALYERCEKMAEMKGITVSEFIRSCLISYFSALDKVKQKRVCVEQEEDEENA